jgi:hypothetical protein
MSNGWKAKYEYLAVAEIVLGQAIENCANFKNRFI